MTQNNVIEYNVEKLSASRASDIDIIRAIIVIVSMAAVVRGNMNKN